MQEADKLERLLDSVIFVDPESPTPLYAQLTRTLRRLIHTEFHAGDRFFGEGMLSRSLGISVSTARRSLTDLTEEGLLVRKVPQGTFVTEQAGRTMGAFRIAALVSSYDSHFNTRLLEHMDRLCSQRGMLLEVFSTRDIRRILRAAGEMRPEREGFVFVATLEAATWGLYQSLSERGFRTVSIDRRMEGYHGAIVGVDNTAGMYIGLDYLLESGHTNITLLVCEDILHPNIQERIEAFRRYTRENEGNQGRIVTCDQNIEYPPGLTPQEKYALYVDDGIVDQILAHTPRPTAIFALSDASAWVLLQRLAERGLRVPEDCSVLGFGNDAFSCLTYPALTTVGQPYAQIAECAVDLASTPGRPLESCFLKPSLVIRHSAACLSSR